MVKSKKVAESVEEGNVTEVSFVEPRKTIYEEVQMDDGSTIKFPGKRRLLKESEIAADGTIVTRFAFRNGEVRTFTLAPGADLLALRHHGEPWWTLECQTAHDQGRGVHYSRERVACT